MQTLERCIRLPIVSNRVGLSPTSIWRLEKRGQFPKRRQLSPGCVGWLESEINAWLESRSCVEEAVK